MVHIFKAVFSSVWSILMVHAENYLNYHHNYEEDQSNVAFVSIGNDHCIILMQFLI